VLAAEGLDGEGGPDLLALTTEVDVARLAGAVDAIYGPPLAGLEGLPVA
jgi:hypothetical protein